MVSSKSNFEYLDTIVYKCSPDFRLEDGDLIRHCGPNNVWTGKPPVCKDTSCGKPQLAMDASVTYTGTKFGDSVTYDCNPGYRITGLHQVRYCLFNNTWTGDPPTCEGMICGYPDRGQGTIMTVNGRNYWNEVTYKCKQGFRHLSGDLKRFCSINEKWTGTPPLCVAANCGEPDFVPFTFMQRTGIHYKDVAIYTCKPNYRPVAGSFTRICTANNTWSGTAPICELAGCREPVKGAHTITNTTGDLHWDQITATCLTGYRRVSGDYVRFCNANNTWTGSPLVCEDTSCGLPESGGYSQVNSTGEWLSDIATYNCIPGYRKLSGETVRVCLPNQTWSGQPLKCQDSRCPTTDIVVKHASYQLRGNVIGDVVRYTCNDQHQLISGDLTRVCLETRNWSGSPPICQDTNCGKLPDVKHAKFVQTGHYSGDYVKYECKPGYRLVSGDVFRFCFSNRTWSGSSPVCKDMSCPKPEPLDHGTVSFNGTQYWDSVVYTCDVSYRIVNGDSQRFCSGDNNWTGKKPTCRAIHCPRADTVENANHLFTGDRPKDTVHYKCKPGFIMDGDANRTCQMNGSWTGLPPKCLRTFCGFPGCVRFADISAEGFKYGDRVNYTCEKNYQLIGGSGERVCQENGTWSGFLPSCIRTVTMAPIVEIKKPSKSKPIVQPKEAPKANAIGSVIMIIMICVVVFFFLIDIGTYYQNFKYMKNSFKMYYKYRQRLKMRKRNAEVIPKFTSLSQLAPAYQLHKRHFDKTQQTTNLENSDEVEEGTFDSMTSCNNLPKTKYATRIVTARPPPRMNFTGTEKLSVL
ncbi:CUB and sushi domain-containing protein 1-like [Tubulanus polymorphus]|uniref:CUB and sushi domain-containing protein 1-like n=1 Tax=Tubulanus polymorphus TaxID=672921 RepID=UPI003DA39EB1